VRRARHDLERRVRDRAQNLAQVVGAADGFVHAAEGLQKLAIVFAGAGVADDLRNRPDRNDEVFVGLFGQRDTQPSAIGNRTAQLDDVAGAQECLRRLAEHDALGAANHGRAVGTAEILEDHAVRAEDDASVLRGDVTRAHREVVVRPSTDGDDVAIGRKCASLLVAGDDLDTDAHRVIAARRFIRRARRSGTSPA
jgi:hypothetical protein